MDNIHKIINYLGKHPGESFTMHGLSKRLNIPYATLYRVLQAIPELITKQVVGKAILVGLKKSNTLSYLIVSSIEETKEYLHKQPIIKKIADELPQGDYCVILFGSYAKGQQTRKSDIDIMVISRTGKKEPDFSRYEVLFGIDVNPLFFSKKEFVHMLRDTEENVGTQALKNQVILYNPEYFWKLIYEL